MPSPGEFFNRLLAAPAVAQAQFAYTTNSDGASITITGYTGFGGAVTIPEAIKGLAVTCIGTDAFYGNTSVTGLAIPASVTNIGGNSLLGCFSLTAITVDANNPAYSSLQGVLFDKSQTTLIHYPCGVVGEYTIPGSVTSIGPAAFWDCTNLTGVMIPDSVTNIAGSAFQFTTLSSITIPNSVTNIGEGAFWECGLTNAIIGSGVTGIEPWAFGYCGRLTSVYFQGNAPHVDTDAFIGDTKATLFYVPCTFGWGSTFSGLSAVSEGLGYTTNAGVITITAYSNSCPDVIIPATINLLAVKSIGPNAFENLPNLSSVTIAASVTSLRYALFTESSNLTSVYFQGNAPAVVGNPYDGPVFYGNKSLTVYYLPGTTGWSNTFEGVPAVPWNPLVQTGGGRFGVQNGQFGFDIEGTAGIPIVVEGCTNLAKPVWTRLTNGMLTGGLFHFSEPAQAEGPGRFYRISSP